MSKVMRFEFMLSFLFLAMWDQFGLWDAIHTVFSFNAGWFLKYIGDKLMS